jgi:hypothetical protein
MEQVAEEPWQRSTGSTDTYDPSPRFVLRGILGQCRAANVALFPLAPWLLWFMHGTVQHQVRAARTQSDRG